MIRKGSLRCFSELSDLIEARVPKGSAGRSPHEKEGTEGPTSGPKPASADKAAEVAEGEDDGGGKYKGGGEVGSERPAPGSPSESALRGVPVLGSSDVKV